MLKPRLDRCPTLEHNASALYGLRGWPLALLLFSAADRKHMEYNASGSIWKGHYESQSVNNLSTDILLERGARSVIIARFTISKYSHPYFVSLY